MEGQKEGTVQRAGSLYKLMRVLNKAFTFLTDLGAVLATIILIMMTLMICYSVIMRYYFGMPAGWSNELAEYALLYITFFGATWLLKRDGHVRVDVLLNYISDRGRTILNFWTTLLAVAICAFITYHGTLSTIDHFQRGIPVIKSLAVAKYLLLWVIPAGMFMLTLQFVRDFIVQARQLLGLIKGKTAQEQVKDNTI